MLRTVYVALVALISTLIFAPVVIVVARFSPRSGLIEWAVRSWGNWIGRAAGISISVLGLEQLERDRRYVLVANHHSYLDIPCLLWTLPKPLRFFAKKSLFSIPLFGWGLKSAGFIPIDRKNRSNAKASFDLAGSRIRGGDSIVVFPEEGRTREWRMRPFQRGAFLLAIRSELPIVPIAIVGTYAILPATRTTIRPGPVTVRIGQPIETAGLGVRAKDELMTRVRAEIAGMLGQEP